eukprot:8260816-Pyramimonas_sp.AAC.1
MHLSSEVAETCLTGRVPVGTGCSYVVSAAHVSHSTPDSDSYGTKDSNANPMAPLRGGGGGTVSYRMLPRTASSKKTPIGIRGWTPGV